MQIAIISFTDYGLTMANCLSQCLSTEANILTVDRSGVNGVSVMKWTEKYFETANVLIYVGAAGIAVRAISRYLKDKTKDPAVIVVDEAGQYIIPILSGHIGGANRVARNIATMIGATSVITTATDTRGVFAVDIWAKDHNMAIYNPRCIVNVSSKVLEGKKIKINTSFPINDTLPENMELGKDKPDIDIDIFYQNNYGSLVLVPKIGVLGIGCRKGIPFERIQKAFEVFCETNSIYKECICKVCSIDIKKEEQGILEFCDKNKFEYSCFTSRQLKKMDGQFTSSEFVQSKTGVDNVCERSAVLGSDGKLLISKTKFEGITMAFAVQQFSIKFNIE